MRLSREKLSKLDSLLATNTWAANCLSVSVPVEDRDALVADLRESLGMLERAKELLSEGVKSPNKRTILALVLHGEIVSFLTEGGKAARL